MFVLELFSGRRPFPPVRLEWNKGKTTLAVAAWEEWRLIPPSPLVLSCGAQRTEKMTRRYGITRTERSELELSLNSSIGVKGIAGIESAIKDTTSTEISFQAGEETESTFTFTAPPNGRRIVMLYQLTHGIHLSFEDRRFWHRDAWERPFVAWLAPVFDASKVEPIHPACGGGIDLDKQATANPVQIASAVVGKLGVQWTDDKSIHFADQDRSLNAYFRFSPDEAIASLTSNELPDYLCFLAGLHTDEQVEMTARQVAVPPLGEPSLTQGSVRTISMDDEHLAIAGENEASWALV